MDIENKVNSNEFSDDNLTITKNVKLPSGVHTHNDEVELTLVKSTDDEEQVGWQGAWKLESRYNRGKVFLPSNKLIPIRTRIATQKDFDLWKKGEKIFEYDEFLKI